MTGGGEMPEGATPLTPEEIAGLKHKHVTTRGQLDELEQGNIQEGLLWINRRRDRRKVLTEAFVRELHKRLFGEVWSWAGEFRATEKNIGVTPHQIAPQLQDLLADVSYWTEHKTYSAVEICARFHHRLVYIHPFANGNGRHARILADIVAAELLETKPIDWAKGTDLQKLGSRRTEYIAALRKADAKDYRSLLAFARDEPDSERKLKP